MLGGLRPYLLASAALMIGCIAAFAQAPAAEKPADQKPHRFALVIGNATYAAGPLPTAANDAGLIAESFALHGFDVTAAADADRATTRKIVDAFLDKVKAAGPETVAVAYLAGYGVQVDGDDFLVPVDAVIPRDVDVAANAFPLSALVKPLADLPAKTRLVVEDLARATPFAHDGAPLASGLALVDAPKGSLVAANTSPGAEAPTDVATYGTYARVLSELLDMPGPLSGVLFDRVRLRVAQTTDGATVPWDDSKLDGGSAIGGAGLAEALAQATPPERSIAGLSPDVGFFLTLSRDRLAGYEDYAAAFAGDPLVIRARTMAAVRREARIWAASVAANAAPAYWTYMRLYPHGPHIYDARRRLAAVQAPLDPPPRFDAWSFGDMGQPTTGELAILDKHRPPPFDDPAWIPLPQPPDGLLAPPPPDEFDASLPLLPLAGALPLRLPRQLPADAQIGIIDEPFVPGRGEIVSRYRHGTAGTLVLETTSGGKIVSRTIASLESGGRVVTQRDAAGKIISRIVTSPGADGITTVQTGPTGGILAKVVTRTDPSGAHAMALFDGGNQVVATIDRDKNGVVTDMKRIAAASAGPAFVFEPATTANGPPRAERADRALAAKRPTDPAGNGRGAPPPAAQPAADPPPAPPPELTVEAAPPPPTAAPPKPVAPAPAPAKPKSVTAPHSVAASPQRRRATAPPQPGRAALRSSPNAKGKTPKPRQPPSPRRIHERPRPHRK